MMGTSAVRVFLVDLMTHRARSERQPWWESRVRAAGYEHGYGYLSRMKCAGLHVP
jgi:hypothetical protein